MSASLWEQHHLGDSCFRVQNRAGTEVAQETEYGDLQSAKASSLWTVYPCEYLHRMHSRTHLVVDVIAVSIEDPLDVLLLEILRAKYRQSFTKSTRILEGGFHRIQFQSQPRERKTNTTHEVNVGLGISTGGGRRESSLP